MTKLARVLVRMPVELWEEVKAWAAEDGRSMNQQIIYVLRRAMKEWRN